MVINRHICIKSITNKSEVRHCCIQLTKKLTEFCINILRVRLVIFMYNHTYINYKHLDSQNRNKKIKKLMIKEQSKRLLQQIFV